MAAWASTGLKGLDKTLCDLKKGDNVVWQIDDIEDYAGDISFTLNKKTPLMTLDSLDRQQWGEISPGFAPDSAEKVGIALVTREFGGQQEPTIVNRLVKSIALHEVKHKWDEKTGAEKSRERENENCTYL